MNISIYTLDNDEVVYLIHDFIRFAYNEIQTNGWKKRRIDIRKKYNILDYIGSSNINEEFTFDEMLEKNYFDLDKTLLDFFCKEIKWRGWIDAYYFNQHPDYKEKDFNCFEIYWVLTVLINQWFSKKNITVDEIKNILGLDFCLK